MHLTDTQFFAAVVICVVAVLLTGYGAVRAFDQWRWIRQMRREATRNWLTRDMKDRVRS